MQPLLDKNGNELQIGDKVRMTHLGMTIYAVVTAIGADGCFYEIPDASDRAYGPFPASEWEMVDDPLKCVLEKMLDDAAMSREGAVSICAKEIRRMIDRHPELLYEE